MAEHPKGSIVTGKVIEVEQRVAKLELAEGVEGFLRASDIARERVEDARTVLNVGDDVEARIVTIDRKNRTLGVSIKAKEMYDEDQAMKEYNDGVEEEGATTMGDLLKRQIEGQDS